MKKFFLTLDFEEWYHLEYFKDIRKNQNFDHFVFRLDNFFDFLQNNNIKITVFVVAELALKYSPYFPFPYLQLLIDYYFI